jgi:phosphoesterase RecJ-like protein
MRLSMDDRIAWTVLTEDAFADTGATEVHTEGLTNELLAIDSVQIAAVIRQPIGGVIRASIRSREQYDISVIARLFGGGGHRNASGCTFTGTIESAETDLVKELERCLES